MAFGFGGKRKGKGAPIGNKNAAGPHNGNASKGGMRNAIVGHAFGPAGTFLSGAYIGASKDSRARSRHTKTSAALGAATYGAGAYIGGKVIGLDNGDAARLALMGAGVGGAAGGVTAKAGQLTGKVLSGGGYKEPGKLSTPKVKASKHKRKKA